MSEDDYISKLWSRWPREHGEEVSLETIALADEAVQAFPRSARLWCIRGDLIQLGPEGCPHSLDDARGCYQRAIEIYPNFIEAWESLGHFYNDVLDDETKAQNFFNEVDRLKGHHVV